MPRKLHREPPSGEFSLLQHLRVAWRGRRRQDGDAGEPRNDLLQKLQLFSAYLRGKGGQPSNVPSRSRKAGDKPVSNRVVIKRHDNGNPRSDFLNRARGRRTARDDDVNLETRPIGGDLIAALRFSFGRAPLDDNVLALRSVRGVSVLEIGKADKIRVANERKATGLIFETRRFSESRVAGGE